ncbi:threonine/serine ThrE exporter family protein [Nocardioides daejeonensis]|uniref:threonine/serine ThrE exporter family protein n=1 Tax=Nocardioides daejeonensis TaxID=1046556 RepID=UPI001EF4E53E|nr:threonine/serine exporter family protein [Nocardioides daejeonensis]
MTEQERSIPAVMDLSLRIGELLLDNGAGAADVTATMQAVAYHHGLRTAIVDVTFTTLSISYQATQDDAPMTQIRTVKQREIDYEDLTRIDHLVRDILADRVDVAEARAEVARLTSSGHHRHRAAITLGWGVMCAGVAFMLGGEWIVCALAFVSAMLIDRTQHAMARRRLPTFYLQVVGGAIATLLAVGAAAAEWEVDPSLVVTANIIMLLSGIGFMGGLQDALTGFYITAGARMTEALLSTAGIIAGVTGGLSVGTVLGVEVGRLNPGAFGLESWPVLALGGAISAAAFAYASYSPKRVLVPIAVIAAIGILITNYVELAGFGRPWAVATASFFVGLVAFSAAGAVRVPPLVVVVSAVVPMLPGLSIYRGLSLLAEGDGHTSRGLLAVITAASVALAIAAGVILGEYIAQPLKREARKIETRLSGPRLVGPLRLRSGRASRRRTAEE